MNTTGADLLKPVYDYLDGLIRDEGDVLFMVFVYAAIPFLVWVLSGGLRRKLYRGRPVPHVTIGVYLPIGRPPSEPPDLPPTCIGSGPDSFVDDDGDSFAG